MINEIENSYIHQLLEHDPLEYMRSLFIEDNQLFYNLRDELVLRGIGFKQEYQNNYLLGRNYVIRSILMKAQNEDSFKEINFSMHGATNFIERFNIKSDLFFRNVPWEGILHMIPNASPEILKKEFEKEGFSFVSIENYKAISLDSFEVSDAEVIYETSNHAYDKYSRLHLPVEYYFEGNLYRHFITYCHNNKISRFSELTIDKIKDYGKQKFAREKTVRQIKKIYHEINKMFNPLPYEFQETLDLFQENNFKKLCNVAGVSYLEKLNMFYENENVFEYSFNYDEIEQFCSYVNDNIEEIIKNKEKENKQEKLMLIVDEINNHPNYKYILSNSIQELAEMFALNKEKLPSHTLYMYDILEDINYISFLENVLNKLNSLVSLEETIKKTIERLSPREREVIELRGTMTLQAAGEVLGVTRERVRQIEAKAQRIIMRYRNQSKIDVFFKFYTEHSKLVDIQELCRAFDISDALEVIIIEKYLNHSKAIRYISNIDRFINTQDYELIEDSLSKVDLSESIIEISELRQLIPIEVIEELQEVIDILIKSEGFLRKDNIYIKEKISIIDRINYLFKRYISKPLRMDDEGYEYFKSLMNDVFDISYESSKRSATARIADGENVILVDGNTFFKHEESNITNTFLYSLEEIIDGVLRTQPYADPRNIYSANINLMKATGLYSPVHLYSIVQLYLGDKYETGHRNTLYIYKADENVIDSESILLNYLAANKHEVRFKKILEDLNWKVLKLEQLLYRIDSAVIVKDKNIKTIESFEFTDEELNELRKTIIKKFRKGYLFTEDLAFDLAFNENLESLIERTDLTDITTLSSIVKWLDKEVFGQPRMLYKKESNIKTAEQALTKEFPELVSRNDLFNYIQEKGYSAQKIGGVPFTIVEEGLYYPYSSTQFINANIVSFKEEVEHSLRIYLDNQFGDKPYKSVFSMVGYSHELLSISNYNWTEWLIHHFAEKIGYRKLNIYNQDYRYNKLLLVKEDSEIYTLEDLVYYIAKTEYQDRMHEEDFAKYLASKNIIYNPRRLSSEIYNSKYFEFDNFGFFRLR